jgi:predicted secreted protein
MSSSGMSQMVVTMPTQPIVPTNGSAFAASKAGAEVEFRTPGIARDPGAYEIELTSPMTNRCLILAHCAFAKTVRARDGDDGPMVQVLKFVTNHRLNFHQLPCPETLFGKGGLPRKSHGKAWYESNGFREFCREKAAEQADYIATLANAGRDIIGIVGMEFSPSCSTVEGSASPYRPYGIFMEELKVALADRALSPPFVSVNEKWPIKLQADLEGLLQTKLV